MENTNKEKLRNTLNKYTQCWDRNSSHKEGDELYYKCSSCKVWRKGVVHSTIQHYALKYYVLIVDVPVIGDEYLELMSQYQVKVWDQLDEEEQGAAIR